VPAFVVPTLRKVREEWGTHCVVGASEIKSLSHSSFVVPTPSTPLRAGSSRKGRG